MKRKVKGTALAILLSLAMAFTMIPMIASNAHAETMYVVVDGIKYELNSIDKTASVSNNEEQFPSRKV